MPINGSARLVWSGTQPDGEIFETGLWLAGANIINAADANTLAGQGITAFQTGLSDFKPLIAAPAAYTTCKAYCYGNGLSAAEYVGEATMGNGGGNGNVGLPLQTCIVATLRTDFSGRRRRGRMYWPATGCGLVAGHYFTEATCTALASALAGLMNSLVNQGSGTPSVYSGVGAMLTPITSITVDNRPDIQRRRANKQAATVVATSSVG